MAPKISLHSYTVTQTDLAGNESGSASLNVTVDSVAAAIDLNSSVAGTQSTLSRAYGAIDVGAGKAIAPNMALAAESSGISTITITVGGTVDTANDQLTLGSATVNLNATAQNGTNVTVGGVTGVDWSYSTGKVLTLTKNGTGASFTAAQAQAIEQALLFKTSNTGAQGIRTFKFAHTDVAGNTNTANSWATVTTTVDLYDVPSYVNNQAVTNNTFGSTGAAIFPTVGTLTSISAPSIQLILSGIDAANDQLVLDTAIGLSSTFAAVSGKTIGTTTGLSYAYDSTSKTVTISKIGGLSSTEILNIAQAIKLKNTQGSPQQGQRSINLALLDSDNQIKEQIQGRVIVDSVLPGTLDLDAATAGMQTSLSGAVDTTALVTGQAFVTGTVGVLTASDIASIKLTVGGVQAGDKLRLDVDVDLSSVLSAQSGKTIGGVTGLSYTYDSNNKILSISKTDGTALTGNNVQSIVQALQLKNASASTGTRSLTIATVDFAGNSSATSTATLDVTALGLVIDLSANDAGSQLSQSIYATALNSGAAFFGVAGGGLVAPTDTGITTITLSLSGAGLDTSNDKLVLGANVLALNANASTTAVSIGGVNVNYSYASSTKTLTITNGSTLSGASVKTVLEAIKLSNAAATPTQGERTATVSVTSGSNTGANSTVTMTVDTLAPSVLDLDSATSGNQTTLTYNDASVYTGGQSLFASVAAPLQTDIASIRISLSGTGLNLSNDKLVLDTAVALGTAATQNNVTVGGVTGLTYVVDPVAKTVTISKTAGSTLSGAQVQTILQAVKLSNGNTPTSGGRTVSVSLTDLAGNQGVSASVTLSDGPVLQSATAVNATLTLTYSSSANLDGTSVPASSDFTLTVNGSPVANAFTNVSITGKTVTLTLSSAVVQGDIIQIDYTPGTNPIKDLNGKTSASLSTYKATNTSVDNTPPALDLNQADGAATIDYTAVMTASNQVLPVQNDTDSTTRALVTEAGRIKQIAVTVNNGVNTANLVNEKISILGTDFVLTGSGVTNGQTITVAGQTWSVSYSAGVFTFSSATGVTATGAQALIRAMTYSASTLPSSPRTLSFVLTDAANNAQTAPAVVTLLQDSGPVLDLNGNGAGIDYTSGTLVQGAAAQALHSTGTLISSFAVPKVTVTVAGVLNGANEKLTVNGGNILLDGSSTPSTVTVAGTNGGTWSVSYAGATQTYTFTLANATALQAQALMQAMTYQNTAAAGVVSDGVRSFTIGMVDQYGVAATPAVANMLVNAALPAASTASTVVATLNAGKTASVSATTGAVTVYDTNQDGTLGEVFDVRFTEPVRVSNVTTVANWTVSSGGLGLGTGASIVALNPVTVGGIAYASSFRVTAGTGYNYTTGTTLTIAATNVVDTGGANASASVVFTLPDVLASAAVTPPLNIASDNAVNSTEKGATTTLTFTNTVIGETLYLYRDGVYVKDVPITATFTNVTLTGAEWGSDGVHTFTAKSADAAGNFSLASAPKLVNVDTGIASGTQSMVVRSDTGTLGASAGDVVRVTFNESLNLLRTGIPSAFGTDATALEVGRVPGVSRTLSSIANGTFDASIASWTATANTGTVPSWDSASKAALFSNASANQGGMLSQAITTVAGQTYTVTYTQTGAAALNVSSSVDAAGVTTSASGTYAYSFTATGTSTTLRFTDATSATGTNVLLDDVWIGGDGLSRVWDITLGTLTTAQANALNNTGGASVGTVAFNNLTDAAGNTGSVASITVSPQLFDQPGGILINNVTADNVLNSSEKASTTSVGLTLTGAKLNDVVKLFMDGVQVGSKALDAADITAIGNGTFSLALNNGVSWGADGERALTASIQRGSGVQLSSDVRMVAVAADGKHWSQGSNLIWFDTDTVVQDMGSTVLTWNASVGASVASVDTTLVTNDAYRPKLVRNSANGRSQIYFNGGNTGNTDWTNGSWMTFTDPNSILGTQSATFTAVNRPYTVISNAQLLQTGSWRYWTELGSFAQGGGSGGVGLGVESSGTALFALTHQATPYITPANSNTLGAQILASHVYTPGTQQLFSNGALIGQLSRNYSILFGGTTTNQKYQYAIGGTGLGNAVTELWKGMVGDIIWSSRAISGNELQEINTYEAVKFATTGTFKSATGIGATYDLSGSNNKTQLLDDVLTLHTSAQGTGNDTVIVAGADYVTTGEGNDTVRIKDLNFRSLDGGKGTDTLQLAADYSGSNTLYLSDYVSNAQGQSGVTADDTRVNAAGYHKLLGFEVIDLSTNAAAQTLTVKPADVNQLSEDNKLWVKLDNTDGVMASGFGTVSYGYWAHTETDGSTAYYDRKWTGTDSSVTPNTTVEMYARSGQFAPGFAQASYSGSTVTVKFDASITGSTLATDWQVSGYTVNTATLSGTGNVNLSLALGSSPTASSVLSLNYSGTLQDAIGQGVRYGKLMVGSSASDSMDASANTQATALFGNGGSDVLKGGSDSDLLFVGGSGNTQLTGNGGADVFKWALNSQGQSTILDFNLSQGDKLDLRSLLEGSGFTKSGLANYLNLTADANTGNPIVQIDPTGGASFSSPALSIVMNNANDVLTSSLSTLIDNRVILV